MASRSAKKGTKNIYNAAGSPEMKSAEDETPDFKKGGVAKKKKDHEKLKSGGMVEGKMEKMRADKKSRHKRASGGRTPYTSGHNTTDSFSAGDKNNGHEDERPAS